MSSSNVERARMEGYLPKEDFDAKLRMALGRLAFMAKRFDEARAWCQKVIDDFGDTPFVPEAIYWEAVSQYSATHDHQLLHDVVKRLEKYPQSEWAAKAIAWSSPEPGKSES